MHDQHPDDVATMADLRLWNFTPDTIEAFMRTLAEVRELPERVYARGDALCP